MQALRVGLDERLYNRPALAQIFGRHRETSLLQLHPERVQVKKLFHAETLGPARLWRIGKTCLDGPSIHRRDNLRQAAHLYDRHIRAALQTITLEKNRGCRIAQSAEPRYAEPFPFELLRTFDFRTGVNRTGKLVLRTGDNSHVRP